MPWLYKWVNRAWRESGHGTTSNARRQRRLAAGISSVRPAYRDLEKGEGEWQWVDDGEEEEEEWGEEWGWGDGWGWDWEEGGQGQSLGWNWAKDDENEPLQKGGRQTPLPPRPSRENPGGAASSSTGAGFEKSPSMESSSSTGHVAKRGRHGPRATQPPVPDGTEIVGGRVKKEKKKKEKKNLCKKEIEEEEFEEFEVEEAEPLQKEKKHENDKEPLQKEDKDENDKQPVILCKKVAIDWHGVLADSDNRVSEDSLCAVEKLLEKGIAVTIMSYGGDARNQKTLSHLKQLRWFDKVSYQFTTRKVGSSGKAAWCRHLKIGCIIDDDVAICQECFAKSIQVFPIIGWSGDHRGLEHMSKGKVSASATLQVAIEKFLAGP